MHRRLSALRETNDLPACSPTRRGDGDASPLGHRPPPSLQRATSELASLSLASAQRPGSVARSADLAAQLQAGMLRRKASYGRLS